MTFTQAVQECFSKYATFSGRAARSEFWYFVLFVIVGQAVANLIDVSSMAWEMGRGGGVLGLLFGLAVLVPNIAVAVRRLHDTDRSGWWWWLWLIPVIGWIILLIFYISEGTRGPNQYGEDPLAGELTSSVPRVPRD